MRTHKIDVEKESEDGFVKYKLSNDVIDCLFETAEDSMKHTYPVSGEGFAVALITDKGHIFGGASYKSDTHNTTMHSEAVALAMAAQNGETAIVAITGPNCHNCKQLIWESSVRSKIDTLVLIKKGNEVKQIPISELMPYPWPDKFGKH